MPSIKSCLASIALLAMTVAPMVSAKGVHADALAARDVTGHMARSVASPQANANMDKRAAAKAAAAKRALARREAKAAAEADPARVASAPKTASSASSSSGGSTLSDGATLSSYNAGSAFMIAAAKMTGNRRCGTSDIPCQAYLTVANGKLPANATAKCSLSGCTYVCNAGYGPYSDGTCQPDTMCGASQCIPVQSGYNTCNGNECIPACYNGASLYSNGSEYACYYTLSDPQHCGPLNSPTLSVCTATSYNGRGTPACINGACGLACPNFQHQYAAKSTAHPFYCA